MRILLASEQGDSSPYIRELSEELRGAGNSVDILDIKNLRVIGGSGGEVLAERRGAAGRLMLRLPKIRRAYAILMQRKLIARLGRYDVLNIHYVSPSYGFVIGFLREKARGIVASFWGSDLLRIDERAKGRLRALLGSVDISTINNSEILPKFGEAFPEHAPACEVVRFGLRSLDVLDEIRKSESKADCKRYFGFPAGKTTVVCGYNAARAQRHLDMIEAIGRLPPVIKRSIIVVIPMTYPSDAGYIASVAAAADLSGVERRIFSESLSLPDVCRLRMASDIAINIQVSDSFSASIQEHCYCGTRMIVGDWLPYRILEEAGFTFTKIPDASGIADAVAALMASQGPVDRDLSGAIGKLREISSWQYARTRWMEVYRRAARIPPVDPAAASG